MNTKQHISLLFFIAIAITFALGFRHYSSTKGHHHFFTTEKALQRNIIAMLKAPGLLIPLEINRIGNLINGIVRSLYVEENALVEEGQLLAEIDDSREDTDVNSAFDDVDAAQAALIYQHALLQRQEALFTRNQISLDLWQQTERDYESATAKVEQTKAIYEQAKLIYNNKRIRAPFSGMIIAKNISVGEAVSNFPPASILYEIAKDISVLKAHMMIDPAALEVLKTNIPVRMTLDIYPHTVFTSVITQITALSHEMGLSTYTYARFFPITKTSTSYCAIAPVDNSNLCLRPGMTFTAHIAIAEKENVLSVPNKIFTISKHSIQQLAEELGYAYKPLDNKKLLELAHIDNAKTLWILNDKTFIERAITVGINDDDFVEIIDGLDGTEDIVYDTQEPHSIKDMLSNLLNRS